MTQSCFVSDDEFDALSEEDFAQPYQEGEDRSTLYPVPKEAMKSIGIHNPAGMREAPLLTSLHSNNVL